MEVNNAVLTRSAARLNEVHNTHGHTLGSEDTSRITDALALACGGLSTLALVGGEAEGPQGHLLTACLEFARIGIKDYDPQRMNVELRLVIDDPAPVGGRVSGFVFPFPSLAWW